MWAVSVTVAADLVSGLTNGRWSISWSEPEPQRISGARPPSTTSGERFCCAPAIGLIPLVTPGPAVSAHTPARRVAFANPSAAQAAEASWRGSDAPASPAPPPAEIQEKGPAPQTDQGAAAP